jgi:hypothetical protein
VVFFGTSTRLQQGSGQANVQFDPHIRSMRIRFPILASAIFLAAVMLLVFRGDLHARDPHHLTAECGFWGPMEAGMSCR